MAGFPPAIAAHAAVGTPVADVDLPLKEGSGKVPLLGAGQASVLVFFRPDQGRSRAALRDLAQCRKALAGKPARWVSLVPESAPAEPVAAMVRESGFDLPVLSDSGDGVYASLGLSLHPVVVIVDRDRKLAAFEPFRSVSFCDVVSAQLRYVLREISQEELRAALDPQPSMQSGPASGGKRYRSLAEALLKTGNHDKAIQNARKSIELEPGSADGHALLGRILLSKGDCPAAVRAFDAALVLDKSSVPARNGIADCARKQ